MKILQYGPTVSLNRLEKTIFQLNIPACLGLHPFFNVDLRRPYHAPLLEQNELQTTEPKDIHLDVHESLLCDTMWDNAYAIQGRTPFPCFKWLKPDNFPRKENGALILK